MNLQEAFDAGFDAVKAYLDHALNEVERRFVAIEARIADLEQRRINDE